ncbi:hypothetical protein F4823DRAFT_562751 [Ustulina deusta]|nr:hypothetical protein F4823DRAFT_562751 [Ustulina deusta]
MANSTSSAVERMNAREALIQLEPGNPARQRAVIELANRIVHREEEGPANPSHRHDREKAEMATCYAVNEALKNAKVEWKTSLDAIELRAWLTDAVKRKKLVGVRNIVCFGLGGPESWTIGDTPTDDAKRRGHGNRSLIQHVAALWMAETIFAASGHREEVKVYCQDSRYRFQDQLALESHGIKLLDGSQDRHEGLVKVGRDSLVFMMSDIARSQPSLRVIYGTTRPAAIICPVMPSNGMAPTLKAALRLIDSEFDRQADWLPFYHPFFHPRRLGPLCMTEEARVAPYPRNEMELAVDGQRPLQGATVWFRKAVFNPTSG